MEGGGSSTAAVGNMVAAKAEADSSSISLHLLGTCR